MPSFIAPLSYYICLYLIIFVANFYKIKDQESENIVDSKREGPRARGNKVADNLTNSETSAKKPTSRRFFFISNEIIYTASGVYILLLRNQQYDAPIMALVMLLIIASLYTVNYAKLFSESYKFKVHMAIIIIIISVTTVSAVLYSDDTTNDAKKKEVKVSAPLKLSPTSIHTYKVIFPYKDESLEEVFENEKIRKSIKQIYGKVRLNNLTFLYETFLDAKNEEDAIKMAKDSFRTDPLIEPKINKKGFKKGDLLIIDGNNIVAKEINSK